MRRLLLITTPELRDTNALIGQSSADRGLPCIPVDPRDRQLDVTPANGDLLYCASSLPSAQALEQHWWHARLGSVHGPSGPQAPAASSVLDRLGLRGTAPPREDTGALLQAVEALGGFPVVLKVPGGEGGRGVMRADSAPALRSLLDYLPEATQMLEYFEHVLSLRLVVAGEAVVATEAWCPPAFDFRTNAGGVCLGPVSAPPAAEAMALQACSAMGLRFGGVDILQNDKGELKLAEVNCPCYFAQQQVTSGVDIAGRLVDELLRRVA